MDYDLEGDYLKAGQYVDYYDQKVKGELDARALVLTARAIPKFAKFVDLPESSSKLGPILDLAFTALALIQPELFLVQYLGTRQQVVARALEIAAHAGRRGAKIAKGLQKAHEVGEKVNKARETTAKVYENVEKIEKESPGTKPLANLNASNTLVKELIESRRQEVAIWNDAHELLLSERENRRDSPSMTRGDSMLDLVKRLLIMPPELTDSEIDQIESLYLWYMIREWARKNAKIVVTTTHYVVGSRDVKFERVEGLTDTQEEAIHELFSMHAPRGRIFSMPPVTDMGATARKWGVHEESRMQVVLPKLR